MELFGKIFQHILPYRGNAGEINDAPLMAMDQA